MKLSDIVDALRAVRDPDTNHGGLLALRRHVSRSRPAADQLLISLLQISPHLQEIHAIWEIQVSAKDIKTTLELLSCTTALLSYTPSSSCPADHQQQIQQALDAFAGVLIQRRLKPLYFHLSSGAKARSNAALALLTAVAGRGGSLLRELVAAFDFTHSALPKLARPPKTSAAAAAGDEVAAVAAGSSDGPEVPAHWLSWNDLSVSRRPSRALFLEWVAMMLQMSDPLLLPVLLQTRPLMSGLLNHLASDPPGVILSLLQLLSNKVLGGSSGGSSAGVSAATQLELWGDAALNQLALIAAPAAVTAADGEAAAAVMSRLADLAAAQRSSTGAGQQQYAAKEDLQILGLKQGSQQQQQDDLMDTDSLGGDGGSSGSSEDDDSDSSSSSGSSDSESIDKPTALRAAAALTAALKQQQQDQRAEALVAAAATAAYDILLMLLTHPTKSLLSAGSSTAAPAAAATTDTTGMSRLDKTLAKSSSSSRSPAAAAASGHLRALRLLQRLQPWISAAHARLIKAVAAAHPQLASELLQSGLGSYPLEPKPCLSYLSSVGVVSTLVAAAAAAPSILQQQCKGALHLVQGVSGSISATAAAGSSVCQRVPDVGDAAVRADIRCCLPDAVHKGLLSRGLQHQNPLVVSATLSMIQQCMAAVQQLVTPVRQVAAAMAAASSNMHQQHQQQQVQDDSQLLQQHDQLLNAQIGATAAAAAVNSAMATVGAAADKWSAFSQQLQHAIRSRAPDISVLVALMTSLQRAAAAAAGSSAGQQQQQQYSSDQLVVLQVQVCGVLEVYVQCLPDAVVDGHVDLHKLMLQGQDLLSAHADVQLAALKVLAAAQQQAAAAEPVLPDANSMSVAHLLPLLKLAAASPAAAVRQMARALLADRMQVFCGSSGSSSSGIEVGIWLQRLPQIWSPQTLDSNIANGDQAAAGEPSSLVINNMLDLEWVYAQVAILNFVAEAIVAVARKPQEPWETIQQTLQSINAAASSSSSSRGSATMARPSLFAVCSFRKMLKLLKSQKAAAAVKAAVCGYVCCVWQQLLLQCVNQAPLRLLLLEQLMREEGEEWVAAATAAAGSSNMATAAASSQPISGSSNKKKRKLEQQQGTAAPLEPQQQQQLLLLPVEAAAIVSLHQCVVSLCMVGELGNEPIMHTPAASNSTKKRKKLNLDHRSTAAAAAAAADHKQPNLHQQLKLLLPSNQDTQQEQLEDKASAVRKVMLAAAVLLDPDGSNSSSVRESTIAAAPEVIVQQWQQLELLLLRSPAAAVRNATHGVFTAAHIAAAALDQIIAESPAAAQAAAAAAAKAAVAYVVQQLPTVLQTHGLTLAELSSSSNSGGTNNHSSIVAAIAVTSAPSPAAAATTLISLCSSSHSSGSSSDSIYMLLLCDCLIQASLGHDLRAAAAAAGEGHILADDPEWRSVVLTLLLPGPQQQQQQLTLLDKQQLASLVCCSMARTAASAAVSSEALDTRLAFGVQLLQCLMLSAGSSSSSSSARVVVDMDVVTTVLSHPVFEQGYLNSSSSSSAVLTKHIVLLLVWLLTSAAPPAPAAAAAAPAPVEQQQSILQACTPCVSKALAAVQQHITELQQGRPEHGGSSSSLVSQPEVDLAVAVSLELLPYIRSISSSGSSQAVEQIIGQLEQLAVPLLAAHGRSSNNKQGAQAAGRGQRTDKGRQQQQQQQQQVKGPAAAAAVVASPAWLQQQLLLVVAELLITHQQQQQQQWGRLLPQQQPMQPAGKSNLQADLWAAVLEQFASHPSDDVDACVAAALGAATSAAAPSAAAAAAALSNVTRGQHDRHQVTAVATELQQTAATPRVLQSCLQHPLNPTRVAVTAQIMILNPTSEIIQCFAAAVVPCVDAAAAAGTANAADAGAGARREAIALLLPAVEAYLGAKLQIDAAAAAAAGGDANGSLKAAAAAPAEDAVVSMFKGALLAYMQRKRRKPQQQQQNSGSSSLSAAAVQSLQQHALPVLQKTLTVAPLDSSSRDKLLLKLLPAAGYTAAAADAKSVEAVATHEQQLQLAAWLVQQQQQQQQHPQDGAAATMQDTAEDTSAAALQQQQLQEVSVFVTCACSSLATLFKHSPWQQQQQQQGLEISRAPLEQSLLDQLNGWVGDLLADIPDVLRNSSSNDSSDHSVLITTSDKVGQSAFAAVLAAVRRLSVPVLQYRFGDSEAVRCLRRLLAALLPGSLAMFDVDQADVVDQQQQQQHDLEPETDVQVIEDISDDHEQATDAEQLAQQHNGQQESMQTPVFNNSGSSSSDDNSSSTSEDSGTVSSGDGDGDEMETGTAAGGSDGNSSSESGGEVSSSSSSDDSVSDHLDLGATTTATSEQQRSESGSLDPAAAVAAAVYNPEAAAAASDLLQLLVSHSAFIPALLLPDQQQPLPAAVAAVARPMFSYMPVVDAVWASEVAVAAHDTHGSGSAAFKHQLVLLLEVLLDMTRLFTDQPQQQQQQQQQPGSADADSDISASVGGSIDQSLLQSLLHLLQVARCGTLSDCDRAMFRVLLLLDKLVPQQQQQHTGDDLDPAPGHLQEAAAAAASSVSFPLAWPRCLFGTAAKLYYEQQRKQASAAAATPTAEFLQTLVRSTSPLDPLRCALTVVCYPDRRCLNPEAEPNGGNDLSDLYHTAAAGSSPLAAAAAYDPASLLLLGLNVLQHGLLDVEGFAECGLLGVVLRSLAAEDDDIRSLAYSCFRLLSKAVQQYLPEAYNPSSPQSHKTTMQQLLKSSKHAHQITALLLFVAAANSTEQQQQIPAAAAVLAAECALLLAAPAAAMHMTVHKLLLRQQALDTNGLQLFSRIMSTAGGGGVRGAAGVMAEKQWLMRLLWLGVRGPLDGRLYRRKYVCETLMTLAGSAAGNYLAAAAAGSSSAVYDAGYMSFGLQIQSTGLRYPSSSSSSSSLDGAVSQVMRQAVGLPGLASHLIRSAGLLPWLAAAAATHIRAATYDSHVSEQLQPSAAATQMAHGETEISVYHLNPPGGSWALGCMLQLLSARVALNKREQAGHVFNAYCAAASSVLAAALTVAGAAAAGPPAVLRMQLPMGMLWQLIGLLLLVIEAAPTAKHRRQFLQMQLHGGALQQLQLLVAAACSTNANRQQCRVDSFCLTMWKQLLAAIVM